MYFYPVSKYEEVLQWTIDVSLLWTPFPPSAISNLTMHHPQLCPTADRDIEIVCVGMYPPGESEIQILANFLAFKPTREEAKTALKPIHDSRPRGAVSERVCEPTTLQGQYDMQAACNPVRSRYISENAYIANDAPVPVVLRQAFTTLPTRASSALYFSMNPTSRRRLGGEAGMALSMQSDHYFAVYTVWEDEKDDESCRKWVNDVMKSVECESVGSYLGDADFRVRRARFWGEEQGKRVMSLRQEWDPEGRICGFLGGDSRENLGNVPEWAGN
jgi:hypothetical protein